MNKLFLFFGLFVLLAFSSCKKDKDNTEIDNKADHFEFIVSSNYLYNYGIQKEKAWVMIYSQENDLLYIQQIENGNTYIVPKFEGQTSGKYMVQFFKSSVRTFRDSSCTYTVSAYPQIEPCTWQLGVEPTSQLAPIGQNSVTVDYPFMDGNIDYGFRNKYSEGHITSSSSILFDQYFNPDNIWIMYINQNEAPHYIWLDNVSLNENYNLSMDDFKEMTDYTEISFPENNSRLVYIESEDDLTTDYWEYYPVFTSFSSNQSVIRAYYPKNLFSGYYTYMVTMTDNVNELMIKKRGAIPDKFEYLDADINIQDQDLNNFQSSFSGQFDVAYINYFYTDHSGIYDQNFQYMIVGSKDNLSNYNAPDLPAEIIAENEDILKVSSLLYGYTLIYDYDAFNSFEDYFSAFTSDPGGYMDKVNLYHKKTIHSTGIKEDPKPTISDLIRQIHNKPENF